MRPKPLQFKLPRLTPILDATGEIELAPLKMRPSGYCFELAWPNTSPNSWLPRDFVDAIVNSRFSIPNYEQPSINHVRHMAESMYHDPLFRSLDTTIRDMLFEHGAASMVRAYFDLLSDYLIGWDDLTRPVVKIVNLAKNEVEPAAPMGTPGPYGVTYADWNVFAGILFWTGRTGGGVVEPLSGAYPTCSCKHAADWQRYLDEKYPLLGACRSSKPSVMKM
jgi:hypothetical protein